MKQHVERLAFDELHRHEVIVLMAEERIERRDPRMIELRERGRLIAESLQQLRIPAHVRAQTLDRDRAVKHHVHAPVDGAHAALADLLDDLVVPDYPANHGSLWDDASRWS